MCRTYNMIGSLAHIKAHLEANNIYEFKSLKDVIQFQNSYQLLRQQIIIDHERLITQEKDMLNLELEQLDIIIGTHKQQTEQKFLGKIETLQQQLHCLSSESAFYSFKSLTKSLRVWSYNRKLQRKKEGLKKEITKSTSKYIKVRHLKSTRFQFITSQFSSAVEESAGADLIEIERKKTVIDQLSTFIYGALGEQTVVKTLEALSDDYFLINDFVVSFSPPLYNRQENEYIKSIQIDHLLVAPSGVFLIETKNWSEHSLSNISLRSPIQQIKRSSFALYKLLNNEISGLNLEKHHWGDKKISIKNLLVLTNSKPKEEFQYVKILNINDLLGYIGYFKPIFSKNETQRVFDYLLNTNGQKNLYL